MVQEDMRGEDFTEAAAIIPGPEVQRESRFALVRDWRFWRLVHRDREIELGSYERYLTLDAVKAQDECH